MKKTLALAAGFVLALAPAGAAFADPGSGNSWGNCGNTASGGKTQITTVTYNNTSGLGGLQTLRGDCDTSTTPTPPGATPPPVIG